MASHGDTLTCTIYSTISTKQTQSEWALDRRDRRNKHSWMAIFHQHKRPMCIYLCIHAHPDGVYTLRVRVMAGGVLCLMVKYVSARALCTSI